MEHNLVAPAVGESITEVRILKWLKSDGAAVKSGEIVVELETDKASVEVAADSAGSLKILQPEGATVLVGGTLATIDDAKAGTASAAPAAAASAAGAGKSTATAAAPQATALAKAPASTASKGGSAPAAAASGAWTPRDLATDGHAHGVNPSMRRMAVDAGVDVTHAATGGALRKVDLLRQLAGQNQPARPAAAAGGPSPAKTSVGIEQVDRPGDRRVEMTRMRAKIAERLVYAQHTAAILTTFNEVDLTRIMQVRNAQKDAFQRKYGVKLGFMSLFTRACILALKEMPEVNASIDGKDLVYHDYFDIGVAVGTPRGLVVPVIRGAQDLTIAELEKAVGEFAEKAKNNKLSIQEMTGGTFTISNGGTYGSLLSTPILNPPQAAILGMHKIQERPIALDGKVVIRPMMYLALSYDHRIIDGKGAVTFLVKVRDLLENPEKLGLEFLDETAPS